MILLHKLEAKTKTLQFSVIQIIADIYRSILNIDYFYQSLEFCSVMKDKTHDCRKNRLAFCSQLFL